MVSTKKLSGNIEGIADRPLARFTQRAAVERTSPKCFPLMKTYIGEIVRAIISRAAIVTMNNSRSTIFAQDVNAAFEMLGIQMAASVTNSTTSFRSCTSAAKSAPPKRKAVGDKPTKPYRHRPGAKAQRMVKYQQKNSECFSIPKRNFDRVVREVTQDYGEFRFAESEGVIDLIQLFVENYMIDLCKKAMMCAEHTGRTTLYARDLELTRTLVGWPFVSSLVERQS